MSDETKNQSKDNGELASLFRRATRLMARAYHSQDHAPHAQHRVLSILRERGPMPQAELQSILDVRSASLSELLHKLESHGLVTRERSENDKRSFVVSATEQARAEHPDGKDRQTADALFACLSDEERGQLRTILDKLVQSLHDEHGCPHGPGGRGKGGGRGRNCDHPGRGKGQGRGDGMGRGQGGGRGGRGRG